MLSLNSVVSLLFSVYSLFCFSVFFLCFFLNYLNIVRKFHFDLSNVFEHTLFGGFSSVDVVFI